MSDRGTSARYGRAVLTLLPDEPEAAPWTARPLARVVEDLLGGLDRVEGRPLVAAVDGRSAGGKSSFAGRLAGHVRGAVVVHTDDVAWWESFFGWDHLLVAGVLEPARRSEEVVFRPPAWDARDRPGAIEVPAGAPLVVVEGVGASRRSLAAYLDAAMWVQSDLTEARRRGIERDGGDEAAADFWAEWNRVEIPFLAADRPWERADAVVCGTPEVTGLAHDPAAEVVVGSLAPVRRES